MCVSIVREGVRLKVDSHGFGQVIMIGLIRIGCGKVAHVATAGGFGVFHQLLVVFLKGVGGQGQVELAQAQVLKHVLVGLVGVSGNAELGAGLSAGIAVNNDAAAKAEDWHKITSTNRGIRTNVLSHTGRLAGRVVEHVAEDAGRLGVFGVLAGSAGKLQLVGVFVFLGVQHVGAFGAEAKGDLLELLGARGLVGGGGLRSRHLCVCCEGEETGGWRRERREDARLWWRQNEKGARSMRCSLAVVEKEERVERVCGSGISRD